MLRLQAKQQTSTTLMSVEKSEGQVSHIAKHLQSSPGTVLQSSFLRKRESSWQAHLKRISPYIVRHLVADGGFHFFDSDQHGSNCDEPGMLHFSTTL